MALTAPEFVSRLSSVVPESSTTVREHFDEHEGELLLHLLVADFRRLALAWFEEGRTDALAGLLDVLDTALRDGDEYVENAIAVSFVEDLGWWEADMQPFITTLPDALANEVERQRHSGK